MYENIDYVFECDLAFAGECRPWAGAVPALGLRSTGTTANASGQSGNTVGTIQPTTSS